MSIKICHRKNETEQNNLHAPHQLFSQCDSATFQDTGLFVTIKTQEDVISNNGLQKLLSIRMTA